MNTGTQGTDLAADVATAAQVLAALGLVTAFGHVSARCGDHMLVTPAAPLAQARADNLVTVPLGAAELPPGAPGEAWIHLALYQARPELLAIARGQPPDAFAVAAVTRELPPLHGQAAWLGPAVPVHDDPRLLRDAGLAAAAAATMGSADALLLRGNGAITTAAAPGLAVARMWLLAAACQTYLAACAAGTPRALTTGEIGSWQAVQAEMLPRLWNHLRYNS
jgi:HCOMODA/2-hydroxy-3-carboxy-muconic semialdehyde decarboxylase